jgi:hypothetical protein
MPNARRAATIESNEGRCRMTVQTERLVAARTPATVWLAIGLVVAVALPYVFADVLAQRTNP